MSLKERVLNGIKERRDNVLEGKFNCIPSPFIRFRNDFPGVEHACYYTVTSATKMGKSQFTSYTFIYNSLFFAYEHKDKIRIKVFMFPLEETPERIFQRFISHLLFVKYKVRIAPKDLRSTLTAVPEEVLKYISREEFQDMLDFFEESVMFFDTANPTGVYKACRDYAEQHGTTYTRPFKKKDEFGNERTYQAFDYYVPDDKDEYRIVILDTINLIETERSLSIKQSIDKMSEYFTKELRNKYGFTIVVIQQQSIESENNDAVKLNRVRPSIANLGDSKYCSRDSEITLGLFSPAKFGMEMYLGYDIRKFKDNIRFLEVITNRNGEMGGIIALFFDGATCSFSELPPPNDTAALEKVYKYLDEIRGVKKTKTFLMKLFRRNG